jgi:hypothetical protein
MESTLPAEPLIDKLVSNSQKTLKSLRDAFTYDNAVPSIVPQTTQDVIENVEQEVEQDENDVNLRKCIIFM